MRGRLFILLVVAIGLSCASVPGGTAKPAGAPGEDRSGKAGPAVDPACEVRDISRAPDGYLIWSPDGEQYVVSRKDAAGTYQLYLGSNNGRSGNEKCFTCTERPNGPTLKKHKMQPQWHPSGKWIMVAAEREKYNRPFLASQKMVEGWLQSGIWVNMYATRPDGSEWYRLSDFGATQRGDGYTGATFTPDGKQAVWAQIVDGNIFANRFGRWELILADFRVDAKGVPSFTNQRNISPPGARWLEPGHFAQDGKSLVLTADVGLSDPQGMDQFILDVTTGALRNLTNSPKVWDEHGVFSPDGRKIFFMSSYPYQSAALSNNTLFLKTEFMLMDADGSNLQQLTHFNVPGYPESSTRGRSVAAVGEWHPSGRSIRALNLFFPEYESWTITFKGPCGRQSTRGR